MKHKYLRELEVPAGVTCTLEKRIFKCEKGSISIERKIIIPGVIVTISGDKVTFTARTGNKKTLANIHTWMAHMRNMFMGLENAFVYHMEVCNVHFPITIKVENNHLIVSNFLGEKEKRTAFILPGVDVKINGVHIEVKSPDVEAAGQTAANIERATLVRKRDRRVFQDGIFITSKPGADS